MQCILVDNVKMAGLESKTVLLVSIEETRNKEHFYIMDLRFGFQGNSLSRKCKLHKPNRSPVKLRISSELMLLWHPALGCAAWTLLGPWVCLGVRLFSQKWKKYR